MSFILTFSLENLKIIYQAKKMLATLESPQELMERSQSDLLYSLCYTHAIQSDILFQELIQVQDPLVAEIEDFTKELMQVWKEKNPQENMCEDDRLGIFIRLLRELYGENPALLTRLKNSISQLLDGYYQIPGGGFAANVLTSIIVSVEVLINKMGFPDDERTQKMILPVVDALKKSQKNPLYLKLSVNDDGVVFTTLLFPELKRKQIFQIYTQLFSSVGMKTLHYLMELKKICDECSASAPPNEWLKNFLKVLHACLFDKGKNAEQRLDLFTQIFFEEEKNAGIHVSETSTEFCKKISSVLNGEMREHRALLEMERSKAIIPSGRSMLHRSIGLFGYPMLPFLGGYKEIMRYKK